MTYFYLPFETLSKMEFDPYKFVLGYTIDFGDGRKYKIVKINEEGKSFEVDRQQEENDK